MTDKNINSRNNSSRCLFHDRGFCKFRDHCRKHHFKNVCQNNECVKKCNNRHPKSCKFLLECRFLAKNIFAFSHAPNKSKESKEIKDHEEEIAKLKVEIVNLKDDVNRKKI